MLFICYSDKISLMKEVHSGRRKESGSRTFRYLEQREVPVGNKLSTPECSAVN